MPYIAELMRRKALVAAVAAFVAGVALIARSVALAAPQPQPAPAPAALEALAGDELGLLDDGLAEAPAPAAGAPIVVYVSGAVAAPDVYSLPAEARVKDLVMAAGGLSADADLDRINLAARITDGEHVVVPRMGEAPPAAADGAGAASDTVGGAIDINSAGADELDALPGIGPAIAERIVSHREANGPFRAVEDLQDVKGIGAALFEQIAPLVTVGP